MAILSNPKARVLVSTASTWELSLKHHQGKLPELSSAISAGSHTQPHRDPFDRMLAAQAELEQLVLLSADPQLASFPCQIRW